MKFKSSHNDDNDSLAEINIIPLVDIMLVLLIIFMVAAPMLEQKDNIKVDIPEASAAATETKSDDVVLQIPESGVIYLNGDDRQKYTLQTIGDHLEEIFENRTKKLIYIEADKEVQYSYVVKIMALAKKAGIEQIGLKTQPEAVPQ